LTGKDVGENSRTARSQFAFVKTLPEKWVLFGSLVTVIVFDLLADLAKDNPVTACATAEVAHSEISGMPTSEDFKTELYRMMNEALFDGKSTAEINAGDLHRRVGGYPGLNHKMPMCCVVMLAAFAPEAGDVILKEPPSGQGANLTIRYVLPKLEPPS
jgi:hypothetical protein